MRNEGKRHEVDNSKNGIKENKEWVSDENTTEMISPID
jgi:hypothetical protein